MDEFNTTEKLELRSKVANGYNLEEMKLLCENLGVRWEDVSTKTTRNMFAQEIVDYFDRRGQLNILRQRVQEDRPNLFSEFLNEQNDFVLHNDVENFQANTLLDGIKRIIPGVIIVAIIIGLLSWMTSAETARQNQPDNFVREYIIIKSI